MPAALAPRAFFVVMLPCNPMNIAHWIVLVALAAAFAMAGFLKTTKKKEELQKKMGWVNDFSAQQVKGIGTLELLAAAGLILPTVTGILPFMARVAAAGLVLMMIGAAYTHFRRKEPQMILINGVLGALALFIALGY